MLKKKILTPKKKYSTDNQEILNSLLESAHTLTPRPKKKNGHSRFCCNVCGFTIQDEIRR